MDLRVTDFLPQDELLLQLAEEAAELSQAAMKLRRVMDGRNPTPVGYQMAVKNLNEEMADVLLCAEQISSLDEKQIARTKQSKLARWMERLKDLRRKEDARKSAWPDD
ncbi:MAG: hypothetical protein IKO00_14525 [Oscillospiraceae bacterium]|nr:hypothetical protein [Oscillospiraceae bacterium]